MFGLWFWKSKSLFLVFGESLHSASAHAHTNFGRRIKTLIQVIYIMNKGGTMWAIRNNTPFRTQRDQFLTWPPKQYLGTAINRITSDISASCQSWLMPFDFFHCLKCSSLALTINSSDMLSWPSWLNKSHCQILPSRYTGSFLYFWIFQLELNSLNGSVR